MHNERRDSFLEWRQQYSDDIRTRAALSRQIGEHQCFCYTGLMTEYWRQQVMPELTWVPYEAVQNRVSNSENPVNTMEGAHVLYLPLGLDPRASVIGFVPALTITAWYELPYAFNSLEQGKLLDVLDQIKRLGGADFEVVSLRRPITSVIAILNDLTKPIVSFAQLDELLKLF